MKQSNYMAFLQEVKQSISRERIYADKLRRLAWGTNTGFCRLIPQIVVRSEGEKEISRLLKLADHHHLPVTFRMAGTSLSGQAVNDSIPIVADKHWEQYGLSVGHEEIVLQPDTIGQRVNELLVPFGRKFAPDPTSVGSAMIGGIIMDNASGMNCGTHANSDKVLLSARIVLADGTILDTEDAVSRATFEVTYRDLLRRICVLRDGVCADEKLPERIHYKYFIKNVTGLNLFPFIRFDDPFDIIAHLMVGSEGTLTSLSQITVKTGCDYPCKANAMLYFKTIKDACRTVVTMRKPTGDNGGWIVKGAELLDWKLLASVSNPVFLKYRGEICLSPLPGIEPGDETGLIVMLTETEAHTDEELERSIGAIGHCLSYFRTYTPVRFTNRPEEYLQYWVIRSGIFPSVGGTRKSGTTRLIEDVTFHIEDLPGATAKLQQLIAWHGYEGAYIYGHALEDNYHFILNQSFGSDAEVKRYEELANNVKTLMVDRYDGSLKAEHGTGRNMAPFIRYEWGDSAYGVVKAVKKLFNLRGLLNPGAIFNDDSKYRIKSFKPLPLVPLDTKSPAAKVNRCTECGFYEVDCLSYGFTPSSRQRAVLQGEIARLRQSGDAPECLALSKKQYLYPRNRTRAGDGLCSMSCPIGINTGDLTHIIRQEELPQDSLDYKAGNFAADHFAGIRSALRPILGLADLGHSILGTKAISSITRGIHNALGIPLWTPAMPKPYEFKPKELKAGDKVVCFPSCINQTMGLLKKSPVEQPLVNKMIALLQEGGYEAIFLKNMEKFCCGAVWKSKGMLGIANRKTAELEAALWEANEEGKYPVLCGQSPCLHRMHNTI